jgi:hypothetical protein
MDASEPQARHRGYFLSSHTDVNDAEGELDSAEGIRIRVRLARPLPRRRLARRMVATVPGTTRRLTPPRVTASTAIGTDKRRSLKSANATDSRPPGRTPR